MMPFKAIMALYNPDRKDRDRDTGTQGQGERDTRQGHREEAGQEQGHRTGTGRGARTGRLRTQPARTTSAHNLLCTTSAGCMNKDCLKGNIQ